MAARHRSINATIASAVWLLFRCMLWMPVTVSLQADEGFDWPGIRGPNWDGHSAETGIVDSWPEQGPPVLWTRELGQGFSSFVASDRAIATQYQNLSGQYVICLDAGTGETIWEHRYDWPYEPAGVYPGPRATPTYHRGRLYCASPAGVIGCLDARSGKLLWSLDLEATFQCNVTTFGYACSPTAVDDIVVLPVGGAGCSMVALDAVTGTVRWKAGDDAGSYAPAYPISVKAEAWCLATWRTSSSATIKRPASNSGVIRCLGDTTNIRPGRSIESHFLWVSSPFQAGSELLELRDDVSQPVEVRRKESTDVERHLFECPRRFRHIWIRCARPAGPNASIDSRRLSMCRHDDRQ